MSLYYVPLKKNLHLIVSVCRLLVIVCFLSGISGCFGARHAGTGDQFYFLQMSDPQFGMYTKNQDFAKETQHFEEAIAAANRLHPAFVIICGDLINQAGDAAQLAEYKRIAAKLQPSIPLYSIPGNHDVGNTPTQASLAAYRNNVGVDYYSFQYGNLFGIVVNSSLIFDPSGAPDEANKQMEWLINTLKATKELKHMQVVVFEHIPPFVNEPDEADGYFNFPTERRKPYLDLLQQYGVNYLFAGHLHKNASGKYKNLSVITTGPVGMPLGKDSSGIRIVKVTKKEITSRYVSLDAIPNRFY